MRTTQLVLSLGVIAASIIGCTGTDTVTHPDAALSAPDYALYSRDGRSNNEENRRDDTVRTLKRTFRITTRISASKLIGPTGGEIVLPGTGARVYFPPFLVPTPTLITMTAKLGDDVAYDFQPHMT